VIIFERAEECRGGSKDSAFKCSSSGSNEKPALCEAQKKLRCSGLQVKFPNDTFFIGDPQDIPNIDEGIEVDELDLLMGHRVLDCLAGFKVLQRRIDYFYGVSE
jgi:hypothetical protein